jgi:putative membrane protein
MEGKRAAHSLRGGLMLGRWIVKFLINAAALAVAAWAVTGIKYDGLGALLAMALVFGVVNAFIKPIVKILSCPLVILTLGLFTFVINALMLYLAGAFAGKLGIGFRVETFGAAFWGAVVVSVVSFILSLLLPTERRRKEE